MLYPIRLAQRLPVIRIPLNPDGPDARLDLQAVFEAAYRQVENTEPAAYFTYDREAEPPLDAGLAAWSNQLLRSKGLR